MSVGKPDRLVYIRTREPGDPDSLLFNPGRADLSSEERFTETQEIAKAQLMAMRALAAAKIEPQRFRGFSLPLAKDEMTVSYCADAAIKEGEDSTKRKCSDVKQITVKVGDRAEIKTLENIRAYFLRRTAAKQWERGCSVM